MMSRFIFLCFALFQVATSQYYTVPASSYPPCFNYFPSSQSSSAPSYAPKTPNLQPRSLIPPPKSPKCIDSTLSPYVKCFPQTASAHFLTPSEKAKANVLNKEHFMEAIGPTPYSCALCNNFADVPPSSKIAPPPAIGSPHLAGIIDKIPTISLPKNLSTEDEASILTTKTSFSDMYEKHKVPKNLTFDQELLEGFLTGLGLNFK